MNGLKPCPFCGASQMGNLVSTKIVRGYGEMRQISTFTVICRECDASVGYHLMPEDAIETWNGRPEV